MNCLLNIANLRALNILTIMNWWERDWAPTFEGTFLIPVPYAYPMSGKSLPAAETSLGYCNRICNLVSKNCEVFIYSDLNWRRLLGTKTYLTYETWIITIQVSKFFLIYMSFQVRVITKIKRQLDIFSFKCWTNCILFGRSLSLSDQIRCSDIIFNQGALGFLRFLCFFVFVTFVVDLYSVISM